MYIEDPNKATYAFLASRALKAWRCALDVFGARGRRRARADEGVAHVLRAQGGWHLLGCVYKLGGPFKGSYGAPLKGLGVHTRQVCT